MCATKSGARSLTFVCLLQQRKLILETIKGIYAEANVFATDMEDYAKAQVKMICDDPVAEGSSIVVMPDAHPGAVGPVGLSMTVGDKVNSNLVGPDIGCGVMVAAIDADRIDFQKLTRVVQERVPSGFDVRTVAHHYAERFDFDAVEAFKSVKQDRAVYSLGTLGGGNHFVEVDKDDEGKHFLVVHSGSRGFGSQVADHYNKVGHDSLKARGMDVPYEMTYLERDLKEAYLHDQALLCDFAQLNRQAIVHEILRGMKWKAIDSFDCRHNYIDMSGDVPMLRKGAISARQGEKVVIPLNMRDGLLIGRGLGNEEWNCTSPHGAGRVMRRSDVRNSHTVAEYREAMKGIHSPSINADTLDESPFAYRDPSVIENAIKETVSIEKVLRSVYNYKAGSNAKGSTLKSMKRQPRLHGSGKDKQNTGRRR